MFPVTPLPVNTPPGRLTSVARLIAGEFRHNSISSPKSKTGFLLTLIVLSSETSQPCASITV